MSDQGFKVLLPDGRNVNLSTKAGADAFVELGGSFQGFSSNLVHMLEPMRKKSKLNAQEKQQMFVGYGVLIHVAMNASPQVFDKIPKSEIECWYDHFNKYIPKVAKSKLWTQKGQLEPHDNALLGICIFFAMHNKAVQVAFEKDMFAPLASFVESRKAPQLPCVDVARSVTHIINNSYLSFSSQQKKSNSHCGENEKFWKKIEASGVLLQYIRCSTYPEIQDVALYMCYDDLMKYLPLLKKKFKKGEPSGDGLHAIIEGKDGSKQKDPKVMRYVQNLYKMAQSSQAKELHVEHGALRVCRYCNKSEISVEFQRSLMQCSRCKQAYYCSKECQKKDWKSHKPHCKILDNKYREKSGLAMQNCILAFAQKNYIKIVDKILDVMEATGLSKEELLLEVDFKPDSDGYVPALDTPARFQLRDTRGYFEGSRPNEPDWYYKGTDIYENNISKSVTALKDQFRRITTNDLLCISRSADGGVGTYRIKLQSERKRAHLFSTEAINAMRSAQCGDYSRLSDIFDDGQIDIIRNSYDGPDQDELDLIRMMMNEKFGALGLAPHYPMRGSRAQGK